MKYIIAFLILLICSPVYSATRIFYEDCEDTVFTDTFLEDNYGTDVESYWEELKAEITQSEDQYAGTYSMTYDPFTVANPHAVVGAGNTTYGNLSNFDLSSINARYWYFRWYQKFQTSINYSGSVDVKLIYINYAGAGDFTLTLQKGDPDQYRVQIDTGLIYNDSDHTGVNIDDNQWHKFELYIDAGTTGGANGEYWLKVDDTEVLSHSNMTFDATINPNPMAYLTGWPSNYSGTPTGTFNTWLDDLEIYTLTSGADLPSDIDTTAPTFSSASIPVGGNTTTVNFSEALTNVSVDVGDFNLDCSTAGDGVDLTYSSGSGTSQWTFLNENQIYSGDTCTLDIVTSAGEATDASDNDLTTANDQTVTNGSQYSTTAAGSFEGAGTGSGGSVTGLGAGAGGRFN